MGGETDPRNAGVPSDQQAPIPSVFAVLPNVGPGTFGAKLMKAVLHDLAKSVWNGHAAELLALVVVERLSVNHDLRRARDRCIDVEALLEQRSRRHDLERRPGRDLAKQRRVEAAAVGAVRDRDHLPGRHPNRHQRTRLIRDRRQRRVGRGFDVLVERRVQRRALHRRLRIDNRGRRRLMKRLDLEARAAGQRRVEVLLKTSKATDVAGDVATVRRVDDLLRHRADGAQQRPGEIVRRAQVFVQVAQHEARDRGQLRGDLLVVRLAQGDDVDELIRGRPLDARHQRRRVDAEDLRHVGRGR